MKRPGSAAIDAVLDKIRKSGAKVLEMVSIDGMGNVWRTGNPPPMFTNRGVSPRPVISWKSWRTRSRPSIQFIGLRHCDPAWNPAPAKSAPRSFARLRMVKASSNVAPNFPTSGQSLPTFGVSSRTKSLASALTAWTFSSSFKLSTTYHSTPREDAKEICSRVRIGFE